MCVHRPKDWIKAIDRWPSAQMVGHGLMAVVLNVDIGSFMAYKELDESIKARD